MTLQIFFSFVVSNLIFSITPGPANITSLSTAIQHGRTVALRQWLGLFTGYAADSILAAFICYFLGAVLNEYVFVLSYIGAAYLVYLAIHMLRSSYGISQKEIKLPGFWTGFFVQITNVKVQITCFTVMTAFVLPYFQGFIPLLLTGLLLPVMPLSGPFCNLIWLFTGVGLQRFFKNHTKTVNIVMSISILICAATLIFK